MSRKKILNKKKCLPCLLHSDSGLNKEEIERLDYLVGEFLASGDSAGLNIEEREKLWVLRFKLMNVLSK